MQIANLVNGNITKYTIGANIEKGNITIDKKKEVFNAKPLYFLNILVKSLQLYMQAFLVCNVFLIRFPWSRLALG